MSLRGENVDSGVSIEMSNYIVVTFCPPALKDSGTKHSRKYQFIQSHPLKLEIVKPEFTSIRSRMKRYPL